MAADVSKGWSEAAEREFIDQLGTLPNARVPRLEAMQNYAKVLAKRVDWGNVDPERIQEYLRKSIRLHEQNLRIRVMRR